MKSQAFINNLFVRYSLLNEDQISAVKQVYGPVLVLAGPGSGKTTVISYRIHNLVKNYKVKPESILLLTFTNKAAQEMNKRIKSLFNIELPYAGTFHSIILKLLKEYISKKLPIESTQFYYVNHKLNLIDEEDKLDILKTIVKLYKFDKKKNINILDLANFISGVKNKKKNLNDFGIYKEIFYIYNDVLRKQYMIDFDDLLTLGIEIFNNFNIKKDLKNRFNFLMVDEFQDINYLQFEFLNKFELNNIFVVGDDDQNIYSFRNSDVRFILEFSNYYKNPTVIKLRYNYRSYQEIIDFSLDVIKYVSFRYPKDLLAFKKSNPDSICVNLFKTELEEDNFILNKIKEIQQQIKSSNKLTSTNSVVVLCRTNEIVKYIEKLFISNSIPVKAIGSYNFFNRREIKDIISLFKLVLNFYDDLSFIRVFKNFFNFKKIDKLYTNSMEVGKNLYEYIEINYNKLDEKIINIFNFVDQSVNRIFDYIKLSDWVLDFVFDIKNYFNFDYFSKNSKEFFDLFLKFIDSFQKKKENKDFFDNQKEENFQKDRINLIGDLVDYVSLIRGNDIEIEDLNKINKVIVMTIHCAKGLEFDYVFIPKVKEGIIPHYKSEDIDEECRLFYVAITRAKEKLFITSSNPISRFLLSTKLKIN
ncbi:MAG: ATP-dependent helicase [bacterium]|nr:ATP-dependent helicase [bacterium]